MWLKKICKFDSNYFFGKMRIFYFNCAIKAIS